MANDPSFEYKQIKLNWVYPQDLETHFVTNMVVQHQEDHFIISFFETWPPAITGNVDERHKQLESINEVDAKCVARIVVTPEKMRDFLNAFQENVEKFHLSKKRFEILRERNGENE